MNPRIYRFTLLPLVAAIAAAQAAEDKRPLETRWLVDYSGSAELDVSYVTDDNFMYGRYNANNEEEAQVAGNLDWLWTTNSARWDLVATDIGSDIPYSRIQWDRGDFKVFFELESTFQVSNNTGRSPFRGSENRLPDEWVASNVSAASPP